MNMENDFKKIEELLLSEANKIHPPEQGLRSVLSRMPETVTNNLRVRNNITTAKKGRAADYLIDHLNNIMNSFWKVAVPVGIAVVVIAAVGYWRFAGPGVQPGAEKQAVSQEADVTEFASAEVASSVDAIVDETIDDEAILTADTEDAALEDYDSQAIMAFDSVTSLYE
jgi:hypothetical protein